MPSHRACSWADSCHQGMTWPPFIHGTQLSLYLPMAQMDTRAQQAAVLPPGKCHRIAISGRLYASQWPHHLVLSGPAPQVQPCMQSPTT